MRRAGQRVEEPGAQAQALRSPELGARRRSLTQPLGQSAGCLGVSGPWP